MTDINQLSSTDTLTAGDLLPIWRANNSDTRKTALSVLQAYLQANLTFEAGAFVVQYAAPSATSFTVTLLSNTNNQWLIMSPLAAYAAGTITFPLSSTITDNQEILIFSTQAVTTLTLSGNGASIVGAPTGISQNTGMRFKYNSLAATWYRVEISMTPRTLTGSTGLTVTNGDGISGNPTLTLDQTLVGIAGLTTAADQLVYSTGVDTFATTTFASFGRTLVGSVQQSTTGTATGFTAGAGTAVNDQSTFTGAVGSTAYRVSDIVRALKNVGILAS